MCYIFFSISLFLWRVFFFGLSFSQLYLIHQATVLFQLVCMNLFPSVKRVNIHDGHTVLAQTPLHTQRECSFFMAWTCQLEFICIGEIEAKKAEPFWNKRKNVFFLSPKKDEAMQERRGRLAEFTPRFNPRLWGRTLKVTRTLSLSCVIRRAAQSRAVPAGA